MAIIAAIINMGDQAYTKAKLVKDLEGWGRSDSNTTAGWFSTQSFSSRWFSDDWLSASVKGSSRYAIEQYEIIMEKPIWSQIYNQ